MTYTSSTALYSSLEARTIGFFASAFPSDWDSTGPEVAVEAVTPCSLRTSVTAATNSLTVKVIVGSADSSVGLPRGVYSGRELGGGIWVAVDGFMTLEAFGMARWTMRSGS